jgi:hypothetical protein
MHIAAERTCLHDGRAETVFFDIDVVGIEVDEHIACTNGID